MLARIPEAPKGMHRQTSWCRAGVQRASSTARCGARCQAPHIFSPSPFRTRTVARPEASVLLQGTSTAPVQPLNIHGHPREQHGEGKPGKRDDAAPASQRQRSIARRSAHVGVKRPLQQKEGAAQAAVCVVRRQLACTVACPQRTQSLIILLLTRVPPVNASQRVSDQHGFSEGAGIRLVQGQRSASRR